MSQARELFKAGQLGAAIEELTREVKANPADTQRRTFLFELLCFAGEWDRADKQLDVIGHQSMQAEIGVQTYRNNTKAERDRERLFTNGLQPHFLREPPAYVDWHIDAINLMREGNLREAKELLDRAEEERPAFPGRYNGDQAFADFRDGNDLTGPVIELIVQDQYAWLPCEQITRIEFVPPKSLRDLIWSSVRIEARDGTIGEVYLPNLYPQTSEHADDQVKLGRMTDWKQVGENIQQPFGLRLFSVDGEDRSRLEMQSIEFDAVTAEAQPEETVH
ncbi:MAG: type VI secretion system accessory protein TagJ [Pyrinomonadaceae bacterium]